MFVSLSSRIRFLSGCSNGGGGRDNGRVGAGGMGKTAAIRAMAVPSPATTRGRGGGLGGGVMSEGGIAFATQIRPPGRNLMIP